MEGPPQLGGLDHLRRWYRHMASFEHEFSALPGDSASDMDHITVEAEEQDVPGIVRKTSDDGDIDLFGSSDEDEKDEEVVKAREERLREYRARKAGKPKPAAKTAVILDVKPWGLYLLSCQNGRRSLVKG